MPELHLLRKFQPIHSIYLTLIISSVSVSIASSTSEKVKICPALWLVWPILLTESLVSWKRSEKQNPLYFIVSEFLFKSVQIETPCTSIYYNKGIFLNQILRCTSMKYPNFPLWNPFAWSHRRKKLKSETPTMLHSSWRVLPA